MAGVRISAVTAVGLMTMAAFIGAGGLGYLVFAGIRTTNNYQILAGAIPACILALLVDFLMGLVEKLVTPISLQKSGGLSRKQMKRKRRREKLTLGTAVVLICAIIVGGAVNSRLAGTGKRNYRGRQGFYRAAHSGKPLLRLYRGAYRYPLRAEGKPGGSQVCYQALKKGDIVCTWLHRHSVRKRAEA